jgi:hypothetical protein
MGWSSDRNDCSTVKKAFLGTPDGRRKTGRPKLRWLHCIENDLKSMGVNIWRKEAEDRSVWAIILKEALVKLQGPYAKEEEENEKSRKFKYLNTQFVVAFIPLVLPAGSVSICASTNACNEEI